MKRKLIAAILASAMAFSLAGCGSGGNSGATSNADNAGEASKTASGDEITLTFPTYWVGENVGAVYFEPAVERFNEKYAGQYHVVLEEMVEDTYGEKLTQMAQTGQLPTLIMGVSNQFVETVLIPNKLYYPMNEFLDAHPEVKDLCIENSLEYCTQENGDIVYMPVVTVSNMGSFYNADLYSPDKNIVDMTVDEFIASLGDNRIAFQTVDNAWTSMLFYTSLVANEEGGAELLQQYDGDKLLDYNQACFINAAKKLQEIWKSNASANSVGAAYADAANAFMSEQAAVIWNGAWMNSEFSADASGNWSNNFDGANVKADYYPGNVAICGGTRGYGRYALTNCGTAEERECAMAFLAFIYSQEELEQFALIEGCQVPNLEYSDAFLKSLEEKPLIKAQTELVTEDTVIVPSVSNIMLDSIANDVFANDLVQLVNGVITAEEFCADLTVKSQESAEN